MTNSSIKAIETKYKGYKFRSRLEARWAVFFDNCNADWEYEPEGYDLGNGIYYLPDFLIHNVDGRVGGDLYVEVKGQMTEEDAKKIKEFSKHKPILVLTEIPKGEEMIDIINNVAGLAYDELKGVYPFNFETIDGDHFGAHLGINVDGNFELFGDDNNYLDDMDEESTLMAYYRARQARF